jgi:hypothetical protein
METVEKQTAFFHRYHSPCYLTKSVKDVLITKRKGCLDNQHTEGHPYKLPSDYSPGLAVIEVKRFLEPNAVS